jgi:hypothetical protein
MITLAPFLTDMASGQEVPLPFPSGPVLLAFHNKILRRFEPCTFVPAFGGLGHLEGLNLNRLFPSSGISLSEARSAEGLSK